jgi:hypothetical protein
VEVLSHKIVERTKLKDSNLNQETCYHTTHQLFVAAGGAWGTPANYLPNATSSEAAFRRTISVLAAEALQIHQLPVGGAQFRGRKCQVVKGSKVKIFDLPCENTTCSLTTWQGIAAVVCSMVCRTDYIILRLSSSEEPFNQSAGLSF